MLKHNKRRNTSIIYEQLLSLASRLAFEQKQTEFDFVVSIMKEFFAPNTEIHKEKKVFDCILNSCIKNPDDAFKLLEESISELKVVNQKKLEKEKQKLIQKLDETLGKDFFSITIKNYKLRASLGILSEEVRKNYFNSTPLERTKIKKSLVENMTRSYELKQQENYKVDDLTYKILVKKFDEKYSVLNENQREVLSGYMKHLIEGEGNFDQMLQGKMKHIVNEINSYMASNLQEDLKDKLFDAKMQLKKEDFKNINESNVYMVIKYFDLLDELKEYAEQNQS